MIGFVTKRHIKGNLMTDQDNEVMQTNEENDASKSEVTFAKGSLHKGDTPKPEQKLRKGDARTARMGTGSIPKLIMEFAIPSIVGMLVNGGYNVIDSTLVRQWGKLVFQLQQQQCRL